MASRQQWFETLRLSIQQEHGKGWSIWEIGATKRNPIGHWCPAPLALPRTHCSTVMRGGLTAAAPMQCTHESRQLD